MTALGDARPKIFAALSIKHAPLIRRLSATADIHLPTILSSAMGIGGSDSIRPLSDFRITQPPASTDFDVAARILSNELSFGLSERFGRMVSVPLDGAALSAEWWPIYEGAEIFVRWAEAVGPHRLLLVENDVTPVTFACIIMARSMGIPSVTLQHGVTITRNLHQALHADHACVYGPAGAEWYERGGVSADRLHVTGNPAFDDHFVLAGHANRATVRQSLGLDPTRPLVTIVTTWGNPFSWRNHTLDLIEVYTRLLDDLASLSSTIPFTLFVKRHPTSGMASAWWEDQCRGRRIATAESPTLQGTSPAEYGPLLLASDLVVGFQSTVLLESAFYGTPTVSLNIFRSLEPWERLAVWETRNLEGSRETLFEALRLSFGSRTALAPRIRAILDRRHPFVDGRSGERVCPLLQDIARRPALTPRLTPHESTTHLAG
ncbi:MAG: hypothetical protein HYT87_19090 [Nitrospirae bacterium]|nr:hypothetical protein [Nitrospirota bacterium]